MSWFLVVVGLAAVSYAAVSYFHRSGSLYYYGDAEAHLNIARRVVDSRTPGYEQLGTVWLPLPHLLMLPLVREDGLWRNGLAGSIPSAAAFVLGGAFLFAAVRRALRSGAAGATAAALFALNPNLLYLQSTAMTEPLFLAALAAALYCSVRFGEERSLWTALAAGGAALAGSLVRYEGWFLIPFMAGYFLVVGGEKRWRAAALFVLIAALGPAVWLAHNWWFFGNALEFYNGPYSARALYQRSLDAGMARYPGDHDWAKAFLQFRSAALLCAGVPLFWMGLAGSLAALLKRALWPVVLLALPPVFYVLSIHSAGTPIFVPHLWPHSYYNTRYGLALFPFLVLGAAGLAALAPGRLRTLAALAVIGAGTAPWIAYPRAESWICWKEAQVNSEARRAWTREAAAFLRQQYRRGEGVLASFGDLTGVFRAAGLPLRATLHEGQGPLWLAATARPDLFLWEKWAVAVSGDKVATAIARANKAGPRYDCVKAIAIKGGPVIEVYRRAVPAPPAGAEESR